ncbi:hypothetical protein REPUB_Repub08aG0156300 [Reevesia pubescens]
MSFCNLMDLEASGPKFTWCNKRDGLNYTRVRIDRALANPLWCDLFQSVSVTNLPKTHSDHHPVCVKADYSNPLNPIPKPFRFERAWMLHDHFWIRSAIVGVSRIQLFQSNWKILQQL